MIVRHQNRLPLQTPGCYNESRTAGVVTGTNHHLPIDDVHLKRNDLSLPLQYGYSLTTIDCLLPQALWMSCRWSAMSSR
jgi:hypothetical protein